MATYNQLSYGSKGSEVTELQKLLNQNGYSLDEDGNFGPKTQAAVKDYQQKNNLSVDGIVGTNTWGALTKASTGATTTQPAATTQTAATNNSGFQYGDYQESDVVKQAQALLQQQLANKPGDYTSPWQGQLTDILQQIQNREEFSYDLNNDALYQQYANQYILQGQKAMMDTMGQAQTMTGGYGNSYAQSVGQQAYQGYMQQLNDKVPELYQLALSKYQMEGDEMKDQAALIAQMEDRDYGRYQDQLNQYYTELDQAYNRYDTERDYDYGMWADGRDFGYGQYADDRAYEYQTGRDKIADEQWQKEFDEAVRQWNHANKIATATATGGSSGSSSGGSSGGGPGGGYSGYDNDGLTSAQIAEMQKYYGTSTDGKWGSNSTSAAGGLSAQEAWNAYQKATGGGGNGDGFTGSTYSEAVAYMKQNGVSSAEASGAMTQSEWQRRKNAGSGSAEVKNYSSYKEYLADYVEYKTSK